LKRQSGVAANGGTEISSKIRNLINFICVLLMN